MRMSSKYVLVAVVVVCVSVWFQLSSNPFTLNIFRLFKRSLGSTIPISFYKFALRWPRATCHFRNMHCPNPLPSPYNNMFTIHGLWPQDANDDEIDPYSSNPNCAGGVIPTPPQDLPTYLESTPIYPLLDVQWPDLNNPNNNASNYIFWEDEWSKHGQCSDYPANPYNYFDSAVRLRHTLTPDFGFQSGEYWTVHEIINTIYNYVYHVPEIACNLNQNTGGLQLWEIRLCYDRPTSGQDLVQNIRNCTNPTGKPGTLCYNQYNTYLFVP